MSIIKQIFSQNAHWQINKEFAREYGIECAILMSDLIDKWIYFDLRDSFYNTTENIEADTTLSRYQQDKAIKTLSDCGFIGYSVKGVPARKTFSINEDKIINFFQQTSLRKTDKLDCEKLTNYSDSFSQTLNKNKKKNKEKEEEREPSPSFFSENLKPNDLKEDGFENKKEDIKSLAPKMENLIRKKMNRDEFDSMLRKTDIDFPTLAEMFAEYWVYNKQRDFDTKNWKGIISSFEQWFGIGKVVEFKKKEVTSGINSRPVMDEIIAWVKKIKKIEMTTEDSTEIKKFMAETQLTDDQLKREVTKRFTNGTGDTWKVWLRIAADVEKDYLMER